MSAILIVQKYKSCFCFTISGSNGPLVPLKKQTETVANSLAVGHRTRPSNQMNLNAGTGKSKFDCNRGGNENLNATKYSIYS